MRRSSKLWKLHYLRSRIQKMVELKKEVDARTKIGWMRYKMTPKILGLYENFWLALLYGIKVLGN